MSRAMRSRGSRRTATRGSLAPTSSLVLPAYFFPHSLGVTPTGALIVGAEFNARVTFGGQEFRPKRDVDGATGVTVYGDALLLRFKPRVSLPSP